MTSPVLIHTEEATIKTERIKILLVIDSFSTNIITHKLQHKIQRTIQHKSVNNLLYCENALPAITNYVIHLLLASVLLLVFFNIYTYLTPFNEVLLIRQGNNAAAISLAGALVGFSITIASAILHTANYQEFLAWAAGAMVVQILAYVVTSGLLKMSKDQIEANNTAFGGLLAAISLSIGAINAACIS